MNNLRTWPWDTVVQFTQGRDMYIIDGVRVRYDRTFKVYVEVL